MINKLFNFKFILSVSVLLLFVTSLSIAYENGDYRSTGDGSFEELSTWEVYNNGNWLPASSSVSMQYCDIFIRSGHDIIIESFAVIRKRLFIFSNASLTADTNNSNLKKLYFLGSQIYNKGKLGDHAGNLLMVVYSSDNFNYPYHKIVSVASGEIELKNLSIFANTRIVGETSIENCNIYEDWYSSETNLRLTGNKTIKFFNLNLTNSNVICSVETDVQVINTLNVGGGNSFLEAASLKILYEGNLQLNDSDINGNEVLKLGYNNKFAKLFLKGVNQYKRASISGISNADNWSINYPTEYPYSSGNRIEIKAENAIFENNDQFGFNIQKNVIIVNDEFNNCSFFNSNSGGNYWSLISFIANNRKLRFNNPTFAYKNYNNNYRHNIWLRGWGGGYVQVVEASGNTAGDNFEWDPYNAIYWTSKTNNIDVEIPQNSITQINNYPNPFSSSTTINFQLGNRSKVNLTVFNVKGQLIRKLIDSKVKPGTHAVVWDGFDENNQKVPSGTYFYKLNTNKCNIVKKMILFH